MRISDWSSDVCSSDLLARAIGTAAIGTGRRVQVDPRGIDLQLIERRQARHPGCAEFADELDLVGTDEVVGRAEHAGEAEVELVDVEALVAADIARVLAIARQIGRASWRERVCQYV